MGNKHKDQHVAESFSLGNQFEVIDPEAILNNVESFCKKHISSFAFWPANNRHINLVKEYLHINHLAKFWLDKFLFNVACNLYITYFDNKRKGTFGLNDRIICVEAEKIYNEFLSTFA